MNVRLRIRYGETAVREPVAWFVGGATAEAWLAELAAWRGVTAATRLAIVPDSERDRTPAGVLVVGVGPSDGKPTPAAAAYGVVAGRLYLPVEARIEPEIDQRELGELLAEVGDPSDVFVWHPTAGLIVSPKSRASNIADLLSGSFDQVDSWDAAVPGVGLNGRLISIEPEYLPRAADILEAGRGDIGDSPLDLEKLPPAPGERPPAVSGGAGAAIQRGLLGMLAWLMRQAPHDGPRRTWINSVEDWAAGRLKNLGEKFDSIRRRELERLMNLLKNDPDQGLRFALPMNGGGHRGAAPPGSTLGRHDVDFRLDNFRGGGPADVWDLPPDYHRELLRRYRELAAREVALGRHRRAAYIFASLLGDFRAAANTLADGGHFREAAALYEEKLNQPAEAARCLRQGGLWAEALALYARLGDFETVGDIHQQLDQPEEAEAAWQKAVDVRLDASDVIGAARILEFKLRRRDDAFEHLLAAWPRSKQAAACLTECFRFLARHQLHEESDRLVVRLSETNRHPDMVMALVEILARQAREYPNESVRFRAADQTRIVAADRLAALSLDAVESKLLVDAVTQLVPGDRLLQRDGGRYLRQRSEAAAKAARAKPPAAKRRDRLTVVREFWLPQLDWRCAAAGYDGLFAAGFRDREVVVMRVDWNGADPQEPVGMKWEVDPALTENPILLAVDPYGKSPPVAHVTGAAPPEHSRWFPASDRFPEPTAIGPHRGVGPYTHAFCYSGRETFHTLELGDDVRLVVNGYFGERGHLAGIVSIDFTELLDEDDAPPLAPLPMVVVEETVIVAIGRKVCFASPNRPQQVLELPHPIIRLSASPPQSRVRVFVAMTEGAVMLWGNSPDARQAPLASAMPSPWVALSRDGFVVAASKDEIDVYASAHGKLRLQMRAAGPGWQPIAATSLRHVNRFALMAPDGRVVIYDLPMNSL
jgi:tetratricopeptide (TPR) repeat protein